jgi:hypothetical protein
MQNVIAFVLFNFGVSVASAQEAKAAEPVNNGTDPTKLQTVAEAKYEYLDLQNGFSSGTLRLSYTTPLDDAQSYALRVRVPVTYVDVLGNDGYDIGDASLEISHVFGLTKAHAFVAKGELIFDTAGRPELVLAHGGAFHRGAKDRYEFEQHG